MAIRIWYQSSTAIGKNPVFKPYEEAIARNVRQVVRPDTTVDIHGVDRMSAHYERSEYARYLNGISITRNAIRAEAEGYDALAIGCYTDPCLEQVRDTVGIPSLYMMQTSMHVASMLGRRFAFVSYSTGNLAKMRQLAERYGLADRVAATGRFEADCAAFSAFWRRGQELLDRLPPKPGRGEADKRAAEDIHAAARRAPTSEIRRAAARNAVTPRRIFG